jgi:hypothetical protein
MIYLHATGSGIGLKQARAICYAFDVFLGFEVDLRELKSSVASFAILQPILKQYRIQPTIIPSVCLKRSFSDPRLDLS